MQTATSKGKKSDKNNISGMETHTTPVVWGGQQG